MKYDILIFEAIDRLRLHNPRGLVHIRSFQAFCKHQFLPQNDAAHLQQNWKRHLLNRLKALVNQKKLASDGALRFGFNQIALKITEATKLQAPPSTSPEILFRRIVQRIHLWHRKNNKSVHPERSTKALLKTSLTMPLQPSSPSKQSLKRKRYSDNERLLMELNKQLVQVKQERDKYFREIRSEDRLLRRQTLNLDELEQIMKKEATITRRRLSLGNTVRSDPAILLDSDEDETNWYDASEGGSFEDNSFSMPLTQESLMFDDGFNFADLAPLPLPSPSPPPPLKTLSERSLSSITEISNKGEDVSRDIAVGPEVKIMNLEEAVADVSGKEYVSSNALLSMQRAITSFRQNDDSSEFPNVEIVKDVLGFADSLLQVIMQRKTGMDDKEVLANLLHQLAQQTLLTQQQQIQPFQKDLENTRQELHAQSARHEEELKRLNHTLDVHLSDLTNSQQQVERLNELNEKQAALLQKNEQEFNARIEELRNLNQVKLDEQKGAMNQLLIDLERSEQKWQYQISQEQQSQDALQKELTQVKLNLEEAEKQVLHLSTQYQSAQDLFSEEKKQLSEQLLTSSKNHEEEKAALQGLQETAEAERKQWRQLCNEFEQANFDLRREVEAINQKREQLLKEKQEFSQKWQQQCLIELRTKEQVQKGLNAVIHDLKGVIDHYINNDGSSKRNEISGDMAGQVPDGAQQ